MMRRGGGSCQNLGKGKGHSQLRGITLTGKGSSSLQDLMGGGGGGGGWTCSMDRGNVPKELAGLGWKRFFAAWGGRGIQMKKKKNVLTGRRVQVFKPFVAVEKKRGRN